MAYYVVNTNAQSNGDHEVHDLASKYACLPYPENRHELGYHNNCHEAVRFASATTNLTRINGCAYCCSLCHSS